MIDRLGAGPALNGRCHELVIMPHSWAVCVCVKKERKNERQRKRKRDFSLRGVGGGVVLNNMVPFRTSGGRFEHRLTRLR